MAGGQHAANLAIKRLSKQLLSRGFGGWAETVYRVRLAHVLCKKRYIGCIVCSMRPCLCGESKC